MNEFLGIPIFDNDIYKMLFRFFPQHHILEYYYSGFILFHKPKERLPVHLLHDWNNCVFHLLYTQEI